MRFSNLALVVGIAAIGCRQGGTKPTGTGTTIADPKCGDGQLDDGEECDGSAFGEATCKSLGFDQGTLACDSSCKYAKTLCTKQCGNGVLDAAETCDGDAGLQPCAIFGYESCSASCQRETAHCVTTPFGVGPAFFMTKGGAAVIGDVPPAGAHDLVMAVPAYGRVEVFPWSVQGGFLQTEGRKLSFEVTPVTPWVADVNGDGLNDIVTINNDGAIDALLAKTGGFSHAPVTDGGCLGGHFIGSVALACGSNVQIVNGGGDVTTVLAPIATRSQDGDIWSALPASLLRFASPSFSDGGVYALALNATQLALGDFDGDGDLDLAALEGTAVSVFENSGDHAFAPKTTFTNAAAVSGLIVLDADLDGRPDIAWVTGTDAVIRRNNSGFIFTEVRIANAAGTGALLSTSFGDVDGDGDTDLAVTTSQASDATRTDVQINRVR